MRNHIKVYSIETQNFKADGGAMFGVVPKQMWERVYNADDKNLCECACRCLLIDTGDKKILVDTGIGTKLHPNYAKYHYLFGDDDLLSSLKSIGVQPTDITDVVLTHLHFDHCGGLTVFDENNQSKILFNKAKVWVSKTQWNWANKPNRREKSAYLKENLEPLASYPNLQFVEDNTFMCPEIEFRLFNGHTIGLMSVFINMGNRRLQPLMTLTL